ncbi:hypothetical protein ACFSM7_01500 [Clavibacter michiganensis subsp. tessellarius]|uniref:hypothetical protein n=1 Tax=Clavibacter tessellarius TaxID=31965 RepID=UPI0036370657
MRFGSCGAGELRVGLGGSATRRAARGRGRTGSTPTWCVIEGSPGRMNGGCRARRRRTNAVRPASAAPLARIVYKS